MCSFLPCSRRMARSSSTVNGGVRHARAVCDAGSALGAHVSRDDGRRVQHKARV